MNDQIEILEYNGEGYKSVKYFSTWRVAIINYAERFDENNFSKMERHHLTDEVFILLCGQATLIVGEEQIRYVMKPNKIYNIKKNCWHHIFVSKNAKVLVIENHDTCFDNSEYIIVS